MNYHHEKYMKMALQLAERGRFSVSPNPLVGCVLVKQDRIIGSGWHEKAGHPHAECNAIHNATESTHGATAYITLEPCTHVGRTPPCVPRLIESGIEAVYVATLDPNPLVHGRGIEQLKAAGVDVHVGLCEEESVQQNRYFFHFMKNKTPFVVAKWAMSLDGKISVRQNDDKQLSSFESQEEAHRLRHEVDAILIGSHTAILDNPLLTVRYQNDIAKHPIRIVLCGNNTRVPFDLRILNTDLPSETWIVVPHDIEAAWYDEAIKRNLKVIHGETKAGNIDLSSLMHYLGKHNITSLLVEGGLTVLHSFFNEQLVNESRVFLTPYIIGELPKKSLISFQRISQMGTDYYLTATHEVQHV